MRLLLAAALVFFSGAASAFPNMVRHGYVSCTACHVSPNGGGILTPYGRSLSKEVLSTWGTEKEALFLHSVTLPTWLNAGGDVRAVQTYMNTPRMERARFIFMQADAEAVISKGEWSLVGTLGRQERQTLNDTKAFLISRRHYVLYRPLDELTVRAGRFQTAYGINTEDHMISIKRALKWDEGSETYNLEAAWHGEKYEVFVTGILGRPESPTLNLESGFAVRPAYSLSTRHKVGLGYYYGRNDLGNRHLVGPFALLGFTEKLYLLAELDFQKNAPLGGLSKWGMVDYLKLGYEFFKGVHGYATQELSKPDFNRPSATTESYGLGVQFFPRPHFEISGMLLKTRTGSAKFSDFLWLMWHYYL